MMELRIFVAIAAMLTLPGWAFLVVTRLWCDWPRLQRWCLAIGISIAFYPVLFYAVRWILPGLALGPYAIGGLLLFCLALIAWRLWHSRSEPAYSSPAVPAPDWAALLVFAATLFTRFRVLSNHPYPAWSDSLHHALLTQVTAAGGRLPTDMLPYAPVSLAMYHLGLYALTAPLQWLADIPAHQALLWMAQTLNALSVIGVFLVLDRMAGRLGAVAGAAYVGLLSHQPAFYVNWGRSTQVASQAILLVAWLATWETVALWSRGASVHSRERWLATGVASLLNGGVFLLHFRVAVFYLPLLMLSSGWQFWEGWRGARTAGTPAARGVVAGLAAVGLGSFIIAAPAVFPALTSYLATRLIATAAARSVNVGELRYFSFPLATVPVLAARTWLLALVGLATLFGLVRRNRLVWLMTAWVGVLVLIGNAYRLGLPVLGVTNMGAVLIMLYLPFGLIAGATTEEAADLLDLRRYERLWQAATAAIVVFGLVIGSRRITDIESYRYFVTSADVKAMDWIRKETPPDALFAVNTYFWLEDMPHGTDGGYWIPYFTGRQTTASSMLLSQGRGDYRQEAIALSQAAEALSSDAKAVATLRDLGVDYVYIGKMGDFAGPGLSDAILEQAEGAERVYQADGVSIWRIEDSAGG